MRGSLSKTYGGGLAKWVGYALAFFFAYDAGLHLLNMTGVGGQSWAEAPLKWQAVDVILLGLDLAVVVLLLRRLLLGYALGAIAAFIQIMLATVARAWLLDVPGDPAQHPDIWAGRGAYPAFHVAALIVIALLYLRERRRADHNLRLMG